MNTLKHGGTNYMNNIFDKKIAPIEVPTPPPEQLEAEKRYRNSLTKKKTPKIRAENRIRRAFIPPLEGMFPIQLNNNRIIGLLFF